MKKLGKGEREAPSGGKTKRIVKTAMDKSWKIYGEHLTHLCTRLPRQFYKSMKSMRLQDEHYNPAYNLKDKNGTPVFNEKAIRQRWQDCFKELLNPIEETKQENIY